MSKPSIESAFVQKDDLVLDPSLLDKSVLDRMPSPSGWRMLVIPYVGKRTSKGGIHLTKETVDRESLATVVAYVVKKGPLCYADAEKFGDKPWCEKVAGCLLDVTQALVLSWTMVTRFAS